MDLKNVTGALMMTTILSACAGDSGGGSSNKGNQSVDAKGLCTSEFITDYNAVVYESQQLSFYVTPKDEAKAIKQLEVTKNACEKLFPKHDNVICKAEVDYKETKIDSNGLVAGCEGVKKALKEIQEEKAAKANQENEVR